MVASVSENQYSIDGDENTFSYRYAVQAIYNRIRPLKVSDTVLTQFNIGSDVPLVNLSLSGEDIRSTSLRVVFRTPLDGDDAPDSILMTARVLRTLKEF